MLQPMPYIAIATPEPGTVKTRYMRSIIDTLIDFNVHKLQWSMFYASGSHIPWQRNMLVRSFLSSDATHLLFVDSDMEFDGSLCRRLLSHDKPVIGVACALKMNPPRWNVRFGNKNAEIRDGITQCEGVGFGVMLIQRPVLETMTAKFPALFDTRSEDVDQERGEDYTFCRRWRLDFGGEIWALLDAKIGHIGDYAYGADQSYLDFLKANGAFKPSD